MASMTRRKCLGFAAAGVVCGNATAASKARVLEANDRIL